MKKICHVTSAHKRYDTRIFQKECRTLSKVGYRVFLLVNDDLTDETRENVRIMSTRFQPKNRFERFFKGNKEILKKAIEIDADIYHLHDPDLLLFSLKLKKMGKKVIFDSHENVREDIKDKEYIPKLIRNMTSRFYALLENYIVRRLDAVVGVDPNQMLLLTRIGNNATMVTNFPELSCKEDNNVKKREGICFAGGINSYWSHEKILNILGEAEVPYKICGVADDSYYAKLQKHENWKYVENKGVIRHEEVIVFLQNSIAGMALLKPLNNMGKDGTLGNTKIFEYMRAGIPIIATDFPLWKKIIEENDCGICVDINNEKEILEAIQFLCNNKDKARQMGENGRKAFKKIYNWETQAPLLINLYKKIAD